MFDLNDLKTDINWDINVVVSILYLSTNNI
jgi:hypothetical protein